jgi:hypothetical protein
MITSSQIVTEGISYLCYQGRKTYPEEGGIYF